jgi:hypothetical protein
VYEGGSPCTAVPPTCAHKRCESVDHNRASLSRTHPQSRATLEQQVHSKVSLRRAVDAV